MTSRVNIISEIREQVGGVKHRSASHGAREQVNLWIAPDGKISILPKQPADSKVGLYSSAVMERHERALIEAGFTKVALRMEPGRDVAIEIYGAAAQEIKATLEASHYQIARTEAAVPERARAALIDALETLKRDYVPAKIDREYAQLVYARVAQLAGTVSTSDAVRIKHDVSQFLEGKLDAETAAKRTLKA